MKFINIKFNAAKDDVMPLLKNNELVNEGVRYDSEKGKPFMKFKEKGNNVKIKCEMIGGSTRDNGFLIGT